VGKRHATKRRTRKTKGVKNMPKIIDSQGYEKDYENGSRQRQDAVSSKAEKAIRG
jgi:hypothetical protein